MPSQGLIQSQQMKQEQILAPQQIQSLEILVAPLLELQMKVSQELQENPVLEQEKPGGEELAGDVLTDSSSAENDMDDNRTRDDADKSNQEISLAHIKPRIYFFILTHLNLLEILHQYWQQYFIF